MTIQPLAPDFQDRYPRRGDRLLEEPSAKNAQGLFSPDACIFVGNLSTKVSTDKLAEDLKNVFTQFGPCHVKIKQDKKKGLPGAFVQFEKVDDATAALAWDECTMLHDRLLRIERAKGRRTACLGLRSGGPITQQDVSIALGGRGPLEAYCIESYPTGFQAWTWICKVTFAYVDDCRDAIKSFQRDEKYYLTLLDIDGSPLLPDPERCPPHPRPPLLPRNNNTQSKYNGHRFYRNRPPSYRGGYRGPGRPPHPPFHFCNMPAPGGFPLHPPSMMFNGMPYNETHPPFFPPPFAPHPPPNPEFNGSPFIVSSQARYINPNPAPEVFVPAIDNGPYLVGTQPPYSVPPPFYYSGPYLPPHDYFTPPMSMNNQQSDSFNQYRYDEFHQSRTEPPNPSSNPQYQCQSTPTSLNKSEPVATKKENQKEIPEKEEAGIEFLLDPKQPEKAPKLIRIYNSESESDVEEDNDVSETETEKPPQQSTSLHSVKNNIDGQEKEEKDDDDDDAESDLRSDIVSVCTVGEKITKNTNGHSIERNARRTSRNPSQCRSDSPSRTREPLQASLQPKTDFSIERHVRNAAVRLGHEKDENLLADVVRCLEKELKKNPVAQDSEAVKEKERISLREVDSGSD